MNPNRLSDQEIQQYKKEGYVVGGKIGGQSRFGSDVKLSEWLAGGYLIQYKNFE